MLPSVMGSLSIKTALPYWVKGDQNSPCINQKHTRMWSSICTGETNSNSLCNHRS